MAAKMYTSESESLLIFLVEEAVAVLGNKIVEDLRTQDPDEGIE